MPAFTARTTQRLRAGSLLLGLALWGGPQGASAETGDNLGGRLPVGGGLKCYSRTFDKAHLAAYPKQRITGGRAHDHLGRISPVALRDDRADER